MQQMQTSHRRHKKVQSNVSAWLRCLCDGRRFIYKACQEPLITQTRTLRSLGMSSKPQNVSSMVLKGSLKIRKERKKKKQVQRQHKIRAGVNPSLGIFFFFASQHHCRRHCISGSSLRSDWLQDRQAVSKHTRVHTTVCIVRTTVLYCMYYSMY